LRVVGVATGGSGSIGCGFSLSEARKPSVTPPIKLTLGGQKPLPVKSRVNGSPSDLACRSRYTNEVAVGRNGRAVTVCILFNIFGLKNKGVGNLGGRTHIKTLLEMTGLIPGTGSRPEELF